MQAQRFFEWGVAKLSVAVMAALAMVVLAPGIAHAWYVDISITGGGRVYETTDANELDEHCPDSIEGFASAGNTPTGTLGASCRAGDAAGDYGHGWVVRYVAEPAPGYTFAGWHSDGRTNPGPVLCDGSGGSSSYTGAACQFATFQNLQTRARFVDDTNPSMSSLTGPTQTVNGPGTFHFSAAADPTLSHFECRVGGVHDWQTCSSGRQENPPSGTYTFQVRAVDWSNNRSTESTWQWTVDKITPETSLTTGPTGTVGSTTATFEFTSNEQGTFRCTLDGVTTSCGSPKTYAGLAQGQHTFQVQAIDAAGNVDGSPAQRTWTVDTVAPGTTITSGPEDGSSTTATSATFSFDSEAGAAFRCQIDGQPVENNCSSPKSYSDLGLGSHTFTVWARDGVGNQDATPATRTWTVTAVPSLRISNTDVRERNTNARFTVRLSAASQQTVTVRYATADRTATARRDYAARRGTLTFAPGETVKRISVPIKADRRDERNETFVVRLSGASNAGMADSSGKGKILDND